MSETRIPIQKRSIEKRNKIIDKGFELICKKGYYNITTSDIAKYAKVSTGIIYQYFNDKKEIFVEGTKKYLNSIMFPILSYIDENEKLDKDISPFLKEIISKNKKQHKESERAHKELTSMEHLDNDIEELFKESEKAFSDKLYKLFLNNGYKPNNLEEKTHIIVSLIDSLAHEEVFHQHPSYDYNVMEDIVINMIIDTLKK